MAQAVITPVASGTRSWRWVAVPVVIGALVSLLACVQLFTAAWIFRKLPWRKPAWVNPAHRWTGRLAFAFTLPVAYHCIFKLGFQRPDNRVLAHSLFGCAIYGAFAAKVTILRLHRFPRFVLRSRVDCCSRR